MKYRFFYLLIILMIGFIGGFFGSCSDNSIQEVRENFVNPLEDSKPGVYGYLLRHSENSGKPNSLLDGVKDNEWPVWVQNMEKDPKIAILLLRTIFMKTKEN